MKVSCQSCSSVLNIDDKKIPPGGARIKCPTCQNVFPVKPAAPASSSSVLVPLPGISAAQPQRQAWEEESTRVAEMPMPSAAIPGATTVSAPPTNVKHPAMRSSASGLVPLPGISAAAPQRQQWEDEATRVGGIPLPGAARPSVDLDLGGRTAAVPLPGSVHTTQTAVAPAYVPAPPSRAGAIPLPGAASKYEAPTSLAPPPPPRNTGGSVPLPGSSANSGFSVPLPGAAAPPPPPLPKNTGAVPLPGSSRSSSAGIPLPGASAVPLDDGFPTQGGGIPLPGRSEEISLDDGFSTASIPLPGASAGGYDDGSVPLPGAGGYDDGVPLPGVGGYDDGVPLPGAGAGGYDDGVPLPGAGGYDDGSVPLPGAGGYDDGSVPLPGAGGYDDGVPLPGAGGYDDGSVPLPGAGGYDDGVPLPGAGGYDDGVPLPGAGGYDDGSVPLPGGDSMEFDATNTGAVPLPGNDAKPEYGGGFDFSEAPADPPPAAPGGFDFDAAPPPPAPSGFDFDAAPPPPAPGGFDFAESAAPPPAPGGFDFDAPAAPPPADFGGSSSSGGAFDFGSPPPAAPPGNSGPSMGFGEVDFGGGGDLEFDPTGGASSQKPPADDLEADLSAPLPQSNQAPSGPSDGLEMLSFIDKTAKEAGARPDEMLNVRRFHVKRRSGKVFGPFEEAVVVKMLEDGQLLGNEEVSLDSVDWHAIGTEPALQAVIARLMEAPARTQTQQQMQQVDDARGPSMDRLKQLYEGRMAAVAVVQSKEPIPFKKKLPFIILGVLLLTVLVGGVGLGLATPYGFFALKVLFPAKVKPDTREYGYLQVARKGFLQDTWKSYRLAKDSANQALQIKDYPEARAVWCQAVFYLDRKFGKAEPAELEQAQKEIVNIRLLGEKHPEVLKTEASAALSRKDADAALATIADAVARDGDDLEALFLRAEAYLMKKQPAQAKAEYEAVLKKDPKSAKALHGLGMLHKAQNEFNEAAGKLAEALEADPAHLVSAVELAEIIIIRKKEVERGNELLEKALSDEGRPALSPGAVGKGLALKAESLVVQGKLNEAVPLFEEALKADPSNPFTNGRLAHAYAELNQPDKAAPLFQVAVKAMPESLENTEGYLSSLIILGKMDEATQVMSTANTRFPGNATLSYLTARVADALGNTKDAEEAYKRAIAADPKIIDAYLFLSRNFMRDRRFKEAAPVLENGLAQAPDNAAMRVGMGELAFHERNLERAENEFKKAIELNPYSADAHLGASLVSQERGKFELAATQVEKALELNPRIPGGRLQRGVALWKLGRLDEAITELEAAHEAEPKVTQIVVTLGAVKFDKGDLNGALNHLNSALIAEPGHPDANFFLAKLKNAKNEQTQAIESMKRALDANSKKPLYLYWYGRILADARKGDDALAELKKALEVEPKYADALEAIGKIYFDRNDFQKAVTFYQQALDADPSRLSVRALIGDAQMKMEDWGGAIASYMQALAADPDLKAAYSKLGQAHQEKKQYPQAVKWYRDAIKAEPENADAWLALGYLNQEIGKKKDAVVSFKKFLELRPEAENKKEVGDTIYFLEGNQ
ncbi:MAG: tetratricopeptide repeat protein [Archangium sp.]|nr:tetratricopeptide repeat protein [Archangium sp.]